MRALPLLVVIALVRASPAKTPQSLPDLITWSLGLEGRENEGLTRECSCETPFCQCCVNFNMSYVDFGGPGCVRMRYLSEEEGFSVNVTYGDSQLHSDVIKGTEPTRTCMNLLTELAQICARFPDMTRTSEGIRTCTYLEPTFLGDRQDSYHMGCFLMNPQGISILPSNSTSPEEEEEEEEDEEEETQPESPDEDSFIAAVNESAEEGIAWFSSLLGLNFGSSSGQSSTSNTTSKDDETTTTTP